MKTQTEIRDAFWQTYFVEGKPREYRGKAGSMKPLIILLAVLALDAALHYLPVHAVWCDGHACQLSDGSFRLDPKETARAP